ncbi:putative ribosome-binding factor A, mitochondrial [Centruroides vittatus]|uniref:putative ribosome-binding factor A, mitochondrial n=1 Tax=Centruroides vittatus TaxID=120091 RepID=UPI0035102DC7
MQKLMSRGNQSKRAFSPAKTSKPVTGLINTKRIAALNNLFIEHITDVMSTGEIGSNLRGYDIEITYVKVSSDFSTANVYWTLPSSNFNYIDKVTELLEINARRIRAEICRLNLLGIVPRIQFVKDNNATKIAELERLLSIADYGPDYVPVNSSKLLIEKQNLQYKIHEDDQQNQIMNSLSNEKISTQSKHFYDFPMDMQMDTFGLDHKAIMKKLMQKLKKGKDCNTTINDECDTNADNTEVTYECKKSTNLDDFLKIKKKLLIKNKKSIVNDASESLKVDVIDVAAQNHNYGNDDDIDADDDDDDEMMLKDSALLYDTSTGENYDDDTTNDRHYFPETEFSDKT